MEARLFALQRHGDGHGAFVLVHLGLIITPRGGLSAGAVLSRTQGSWAWILFYGFVACVVHVPIGLRNILVEWLRLGRRAPPVSAGLRRDDPVPGPARGGRRGRAAAMKSARNHQAYWAFLGHRLSGLALALFLPCISTCWHGAGRGPLSTAS